MKTAERFWDRQSKNYDETEKKIEGTYSKTIENIKRYLQPGDTVLDFGCGTGIIASEIAGCVKEIQAIDISSGMLEAAKQKTAERENHNLSFRQATIFDEQLEKGSFDVVLASGVLHFMEDLEKVLLRIHALLKPGGWFISTTACRQENNSMIGFISSGFLLLSKLKLVPYGRFCTISDLEGHFPVTSFQIVDTRSLNFDNMDPPYIFIRFIAARKNQDFFD